jgi:hypothetical protein
MQRRTVVPEGVGDQWYWMTAERSQVYQLEREVSTSSAVDSVAVG